MANSQNSPIMPFFKHRVIKYMESGLVDILLERWLRPKRQAMLILIAGQYV